MSEERRNLWIGNFEPSRYLAQALQRAGDPFRVFPFPPDREALFKVAVRGRALIPSESQVPQTG